MKKNAAIKILSLGLSVALLAGCMAAGATDPAGQEELILATAVETAFLERTAIRNELTYIGQVQPAKTVNVASMLTAEVTSVNFNIGDEVEEGQVLFTVDAQDMHNQIRQLQASMNALNIGVESAQYGLELAIEGSAAQRLQEIQHEMGVAQAQTGLRAANQSRDSATRQRGHLRDQIEEARGDLAAVSRQIVEFTREHHRDTYIRNPFNEDAYDPVLSAQFRQLQQASGSINTMIAGLEAQDEQLRNAARQAEISQQQAGNALGFAEQSLDTYRDLAEEQREQAMRQAELGVQSAQAQLETTQVQLSIAQGNLGRTTITSPISGVVSARNVEVGQLVSGAVLPFTIVQIDPVVVQVSVSETLINLVYVGMEVDVAVQALGGEQNFTGVVTIVAPIANQASTFPVRVELDNPDGLIRPGMFSQVTFIQAQSAGNFVVARNVVMSDEEGQFVYVVEGEKAVRRAVTTGLESGNLIEVTSGLTERDQVVVVGQEFLHEGILVNVVGAR